MKKTLALVLSLITLLAGCNTKNNNAGDLKPDAYYSENDFSVSSATVTDTAAIPEMSEDVLYNKAENTFSGFLAAGNTVENAKIRLYFNADGKCEVLENGINSEKLVSDFTDSVSLYSKYMEICLDSRFPNGIGISVANADSPSDIPDKMPDSYNFAVGYFEGSLSDIKTYPALKQATPVDENEYENIEDSISQLNEYAKAAALTVKQIGFNNSWYDTKYTQMYGTGHTSLCSDENGRWSINEAFNDKILTSVCTKTILLAFNSSEVLSKAKNCSVNLMFYMEEFVGVSAYFLSDMDLFTSNEASALGSYIAPTEEAFYHKSFLSWYGIDGCLKFVNGRLCPVGTYCFDTDAPLGVYMPLSLMGDWKAVTVGGIPFEEYAKENSSKYTDWTNLTFSISEDALFLYGKTISTSLYDIIVSDGKYLIKYRTNMDKDWGRIIINDDGTLTLYLRHYFVNNDTSVPIILERCVVDRTNNQQQPPAITARG